MVKNLSILLRNTSMAGLPEDMDRTLARVQTAVQQFRQRNSKVTVSIPTKNGNEILVAVPKPLLKEIDRIKSACQQVVGDEGAVLYNQWKKEKPEAEEPAPSGEESASSVTASPAAPAVR